MNSAPGSEGLYAIPKIEDWPVYHRGKFMPFQAALAGVSMLHLTKEEAESLRLVLVFADLVRERGKVGKAPIANIKKKSVVRAEYIRRDPRDRGFPTQRAKAAFEYLMASNATYAHYHGLLLDKLFREERNHRAGDPMTWYIPTSQLLLHMHGIEVAAYPVLYPHGAYGDTDIKD